MLLGVYESTCSRSSFISHKMQLCTLNFIELHLVSFSSVFYSFKAFLNRGMLLWASTGSCNAYSSQSTAQSYGPTELLELMFWQCSMLYGSCKRQSTILSHQVTATSSEGPQPCNNNL